jgi:hypothetical protein
MVTPNSRFMRLIVIGWWVITRKRVSVHHGADLPDVEALCREAQSGGNIVWLKIGEICENGLGTYAVCQHFEDIVYTDTHAADTGAPPD